MNSKPEVICSVSESIIQKHNRGARERAILEILYRQGHSPVLAPKAAAALIRGRAPYSPRTPQGQVAQMLLRAGVRARKIGPGRTSQWVVPLPEIARFLAARGPRGGAV